MEGERGQEMPIGSFVSAHSVIRWIELRWVRSLGIQQTATKAQTAMSSFLK